MNQSRWLRIIVLGAFLLAALWAFSTPPPIDGVGSDSQIWGNFHPDEHSHIAVIRYLAAHPGTLPPYRWPYDTSVHPPLYHGVAAIIDHFLVGSLGESATFYLLRLFSAAMGAATVWFCYRAARQTRTARMVALPCAALVALVPMRLSLSGAITNENLAALGAAAVIAYLFEAIRRGYTARRFVLLSFWTLVAVGCKVTCFGLLPAIALGLLLSSGLHAKALMRPACQFAILLVAFALTMGWWFEYNVTHFGDPLRRVAADRLWSDSQPGYSVLGRTHHFAPWRYLVSILGNGWVSFWGKFDGMQHGFPVFVYVLIFMIQCAAFVGLWHRTRRLLERSPAEARIVAVTALFVAWVLLVYCMYNWAHYTPQGRYFFVLLAPFGIMMAGGIDGFLRRYLPGPRTRCGAWRTLGAALLLLNLYALYEMPRHRPALITVQPVEYRHVIHR